MIDAAADFPALEQLARALWRAGTARGAAVLVGAGFSRNAIRAADDTPEPPLWNDLAFKMAAQLYPKNPEAAPTGAPLRLAEEYRTYFGQAALDEFVRKNVPDKAWEPGPLHRALLDLPWSDVLTTNWDTLLERTALTGTDYEIVRTPAEVAHAAPRRIIKLHGSIGTSEHFIFAEEDYRTYPARYAVFMNLARQIFIENELCLVGFSGDDPNFLQWSGWVRDHLGENARRIYLVGALNLGSAQRKFLEARNISPIDLTDLVSHEQTSAERQKAAARQFLTFLAKAEPKSISGWRPADQNAYPAPPADAKDIQRQYRDLDLAASLLVESAKVWRSDREGYPPWLICPAARRQEMIWRSNSLRPKLGAIFEKLNTEQRASILYEIVWRYATTLQPISEELAGLLLPVGDPANICGLNTRQQLDISLALLRAARRAGDEAAFARLMGAIKNSASFSIEVQLEATYQQCLFARDRLDYGQLSAEIEGLVGEDPMWQVKKAALHCDLGEFTKAAELIVRASAELERLQRKDQRSLAIRSRRAWVQWLLPSTARGEFRVRKTPWPAEFRQIDYEPAKEIDAIRNDAENQTRNRQEESVEQVARFEAGFYQDKSSTVRFQSNQSATPLEELDYIIETVGIPTRLHYYHLTGSVAMSAIELDYARTVPWYIRFLREIPSPLDRPFERYFGRVAVANLTIDVAAKLYSDVAKAVKFWRNRVATASNVSDVDELHSIQRLRIYIEVLSRLATRLDSNAASDSFELAKSLASDAALVHPWLFAETKHLASYSIQSVAPTRRSGLVLAALEFPLSGEKIPEKVPFEWGNPVDLLFETEPLRPPGDRRWTQCIERLLHASLASSLSRPEATLRLFYLSKWHCLTDEEQLQYNDVLWSEIDDSPFPLPARTHLLSPTLASVPGPRQAEAIAKVSTILFDKDITETMTLPNALSSLDIQDRLHHLLSIRSSVQMNIKPTREQALRLFDGMIGWWQRHVNSADDTAATGPSLFRNTFYPQAVQILGQVLAHVLVPNFSRADLTQVRADALLALVESGAAQSALLALPYFVDINDGYSSRIAQCIRRGIGSRSHDDVALATEALEIWASGNQAQSVETPVPKAQIRQVISAVEARRSFGRVALLRCLRMFVGRQLVAHADEPDILDGLGDLISDTAYDTIDPDSPAAISISLVRVECVRLAHAMASRHADNPSVIAWLRAPADDPLPEVRFALARE